jgi:uncharacterized membrane protein
MNMKKSHSRPARKSRSSAPSPFATSTRLPEVDMVRGVAVLLMVGFHLVFDLSYFKLIQQDFYNDPFWLGARMLIVTLFLGISGVSLSLGTSRGVNRQRVGRRLLLLSCAAGLVSLGTFAVFPESWVRFGVLHFLVVAGVLGLAFVGLHWAVNLVLGLGVILIGVTLSHHVFDQPWLHWIGLMTHKPRTEDYVPLIPWFGVVLLGLSAGRFLYPSRALSRMGSAPQALGVLALIGRHSLAIYLLHQPLLFGVIWIFAG